MNTKSKRRAALLHRDCVAAKRAGKKFSVAQAELQRENGRFEDLPQTNGETAYRYRGV